MPADQVARDYILYFAEKVRQQTTADKYNGNLAADGKHLGLSLEQFNTVLKMKGGITRELFKNVVSEHRRQNDHWNKLPNDALLKEKNAQCYLVKAYEIVVRTLLKQTLFDNTDVMRNPYRIELMKSDTDAGLYRMQLHYCPKIWFDLENFGLDLQN
ncbi:unnamed protein product [Didymodactylos carnosus]|uniref:Uncharacterized protein n=1 Tax=Didymodactylos carnosus TaxID=1234261 RepID=A0A814TQU4_9BILA|nr:unnamed protein product [Didymodactylos carnosus]CAF3928631.1 unnamed protein product [Didymodactylos carnosus]